MLRQPFEASFERKQITFDQNPMTSILNNIQMKLESIEDRLGKVERLNQRYIERNFDLMQEN
jgi:hypothetical protein